MWIWASIADLFPYGPSTLSLGLSWFSVAQSGRFARSPGIGVFRDGAAMFPGVEDLRLYHSAVDRSVQVRQILFLDGIRSRVHPFPPL